MLTLVQRALHNTGPRYLNVFNRRAAVQHLRQGLRSSTTDRLVVPSAKQDSAGERSFPVVAAKLWNTIPHDVK